MGSKSKIISMAVASISFFVFSSCSLSKQNNAILEQTSAQLTAMHLSSIASVNAEVANSLTRSSSEVLYNRLNALFPSSGTILKAADFNFLSATGLASSLVQLDRPTTTMEQIALKTRVNQLCSQSWVTATTDSGSTGVNSIFWKDSSILLTGESYPTDSKTLRAFLAVRNAWLAPYKAGAPEVTLLVKLMSDLAASGSSAADINKALCIAVISAPQFSLGNALKGDAVRRAALEIARKIPTFQEIQDYVSGNKKLSQLVLEWQTGPSTQAGYLTSMHSLHRDWLGFRGFIDNRVDPRNPAGISSDPRSFAGNVAPNYKYADVSVGGTPLMKVLTNAAPGNPTLDGEICDTSIVDQTFDPRTNYLYWEFYNNTDSRWESVGAYVLKTDSDSSTLSDSSATTPLGKYKSVLSAYVSDSSVVNAAINGCVLESSSARYPDHAVSGFPDYYYCPGLIKKTDNSGFYQSKLGDVDAGTMYATPAVSGNLKFDSTNPLSATIAAEFTPKNTNLRLRRISPSGEQNGVSKVRLWYSGQEAYTCNSLQRHWFTCAFRPQKIVPSRNTYNRQDWTTGGGGGCDYKTNLLERDSTPGHSNNYNCGRIRLERNNFTNTNIVPITIANPVIMNQFRCGVPDSSTLNGSAQISDVSAFENTAYPLAYDLTNYTGSALATTNTLVATGHGGIGTGSGGTYYADFTDEVAAVKRLDTDLTNEPYALLDHILTNNLSYKEYFTADYTMGGEELELFLRTHAESVPTYPSGYTPSGPSSTDRQTIRQIMLAGNSTAKMSSNMMAWVDGNNYNGASPTSRFSPIMMNARPAAGVLAMPAFMGPVSTKMRTIASRYFSRLLCGDPNIFVPDSNQATLHMTHMSDPANPAPANHLNHKTSCYACHINLDPLGAALGKNFLRYVQTLPALDGERAAAKGEMNWQGTGGPNNQFLGARYDDSAKGTGAFLGEEVTGFEGVANKLVKSDLWAQCVVRKAYEYVVGRSILPGDFNSYGKLVDSFKQDYDYNKLIRDIVDSPVFSGDN